MENILFLDFETDTHGTFFCATYQISNVFEQVILNEQLRPLAEEKELRCLAPDVFIREMLALSESSTLAAYSEAEINIIRETLGVGNQKRIDVNYCNMNTAVKKHINAIPSRRQQFNALPPVVLGANAFQQRRMRRSLASVARMFPVRIPACYHQGQTAQRFKAALRGLEVNGGNYSRLTPTQKSKATKALNHNKFDVEVLPVMFEKIYMENPMHIEQSIGMFPI